jgi:hypothetical protein
LPDFDVNDVTSLGLILDVPGYQLPTEAWTAATNVRYENDCVLKGATWRNVLSTAPNDPWFIFPIRLEAVSKFIYASLTKVFLWDQSSTDDISRISYTTNLGRDWNGTLLAGTPVLTNGSDPPEYLPNFNLGTNLAVLPDWTASLGAGAKCKAIRALGPYLVALAPTLSTGPATGDHPHGVLWSHPADPGTVPISWNYADPSKDAGLTELTDSASGPILEGLGLRGQLMIYKEGATHAMKLVGGDFIMQFDPLFVESGILAPRCAAMTGDGKYHFVATNDDIIIHDGVTIESVADKKIRRTLFNNIDTTNYLNSFVFSHPSKREMWFVYPENGEVFPTKAIVWNYGVSDAGALSEQEFRFRSAGVGTITLSETWDSDTDTWDNTKDIWDASLRRQVVLADTARQQLVQLDMGMARSGVNFAGTLTREGISLAGIGKRRDGTPIVNFSDRKFIRRIWIKAEGDPINVRLGLTDTVKGETSWTESKSFDPDTDLYLDFELSGRETPSVEFTMPLTCLRAKVYGYKLEVEVVGRF